MTLKIFFIPKAFEKAENLDTFKKEILPSSFVDGFLLFNEGKDKKYLDKEAEKILVKHEKKIIKNVVENNNSKRKLVL